MPADPPRRRAQEELDKIFGEVEPTTTSDERDPEPQESRDDWYEQNRPPHHDPK